MQIVISSPFLAGSANVLDGGDGEDTLTSGTGNDSMQSGLARIRWSSPLRMGMTRPSLNQGEITSIYASNDLTIVGTNNLAVGDFLFEPLKRHRAAIA